MALAVAHDPFRTAIHNVVLAGESLRSDRDRIDRQVDDFLSRGWTGQAADAFADAWADWRTASREVLDGLEAMGRLLEAVHRDLVECDADSQVSLDLIAQRIVARLG